MDPFGEKKVVVEEGAGGSEEVNSLEEIVGNKLRTIMIPRIDFEDRTLEEAVDFIVMRIAELDSTESDPATRGMGMVIRRPMVKSDSKAIDESGEDLLGEGLGVKRIPELRVRNVSVAAALRYICLMTGMRCELNYKVTLAPRDPNAAWDDVGTVLEEKGDVSRITMKLNQIKLGKFSGVDLSIHSAIDYMRLRSAELDVTEPDPSKKGINFVVFIPKGMKAPVIDEFQIADASVEEMLKEICGKTGMRYELDPYSVILVPEGLK